MVTVGVVRQVAVIVTMNFITGTILVIGSGELRLFVLVAKNVTDVETGPGVGSSVGLWQLHVVQESVETKKKQMRR